MGNSTVLVYCDSPNQPIHPYQSSIINYQLSMNNNEFRNDQSSNYSNSANGTQPSGGFWSMPSNMLIQAELPCSERFTGGWSQLISWP